MFTVNCDSSPNDGVGLARLEFIISNTIGIHPKACLEFDTLPVTARYGAHRFFRTRSADGQKRRRTPPLSRNAGPSRIRRRSGIADDIDPRNDGVLIARYILHRHRFYSYVRTPIPSGHIRT